MKRYAVFVLFLLLITSCGSDTDTSSAHDSDTGFSDKDTSIIDECNNDGDTVDQEMSDSDTYDDSDSVSDADTIADCSEKNLFWIYDLSEMPPENRQICAHIRGEGKHVYILVADEVWGDSVTQKTVDKLIEAWDSKTATSDSQGIYEQVTGLFGNPPDVFDNDPKIYLFLYKMAGYHGYSFDGYFKVEDVRDVAYSNKHEMLHLNTDKYDPTGDYMLAVQSHEFQHLIHWNYDKDEDAWLNESMSEVSMVLTGFETDTKWVNDWLNASNKAPLISSSNAYDYGILLLFGTYMREQFGDNFIRTLVANPDNGVASVEEELTAIGQTLSFRELFNRFATAVAINNPEILDGKYGYTSIEIADTATHSLDKTKTVTLTGNGGIAYLSYKGEIEGKTVTLSTDSFADVDFTIVALNDTDGEILASGVLNKAAHAETLHTNLTGKIKLYLVLSTMKPEKVSIDISFQ